MISGIPRPILSLLLLMACVCASAQTLAVDKTDRLSDDKLVICGRGKPFDLAAVEKLMSEGLQVVSVGHTDSGWVIAMAKGTGYTDQQLNGSPAYPKEWIERQLMDGYRITSLAHGAGNWWVVMSKDSPYGMQHIIGTVWDNAVPKIEEYMDRGEFITACTFGVGKWTVVMSPCSIYTRQVFFKKRDREDLNAEIKRYWNQGYTITSLGLGAGEVLCVMSSFKPGSPYAVEDRALIKSSNFRQELRDFWDQGYHVVSVCNGIFPD